MKRANKNVRAAHVLASHPYAGEYIFGGGSAVAIATFVGSKALSFREWNAVSLAAANGYETVSQVSLGAAAVLACVAGVFENRRHRAEVRIEKALGEIDSHLSTEVGSERLSLGEQFKNFGELVDPKPEDQE